MRRILRAGSVLPVAGLLAACASGGSGSRRATTARRDPLPSRSEFDRMIDGVHRDDPASNTALVRPHTRRFRPQPLPEDLPLPGNVLPRSAWAKGNPVPQYMNRMRPVTRITIHHDGISPFASTNKAEAAARIESIRRGHRGRNFGDIGYHYVIDPAGRVWQGRSLTWQGAHVGAQNDGNLGICVLGNYQNQRPSETQLRAVEHFVAQQMRTHRVGVRQVYTHKELAATACPGRNLQPSIVAMRRSGGTLASVA